MGSKVLKRKKTLRKQLRDLKRQGQAVATKALDKAEEVVSQVAEQAQQMVETVQEKVASGSFEAFAALEELATLPEARLKTFFEAGITSVADFANWTEKELLALKGIGPATIKVLKENGISIK